VIDMTGSGKYERAGTFLGVFRHDLGTQRIPRDGYSANDRSGQYRLVVASDLWSGRVASIELDDEKNHRSENQRGEDEACV